MKFRTAYDNDFGPKGKISDFGESRTIQSAKDESDINLIIDRANRGIFPANAERVGQFADVSDIPDYQQALNIVNDTQEQFYNLPAKMRDRFDNSPQKLLNFLNNPENRDEAVRLGLVNPPSEAAQVDSTEQPADTQTTPAS